jgi:hypothetical protein
VNELGALDLPPPRWDIGGLVRALRPLGLSAEEVGTMCSICAPQRGARGLQRAVLALVRLYPDEAMVTRWQRAVRAWSDRRPDYRGALLDLPRTRAGPVTRFLGEVSPLLPQPLARAVLQRQLRLLEVGQQANAPCYRLFLAARHLLAESRREPEVRVALQAGRYLDAVAVMAPPGVHEPAVLDAYRAALRNAVGRRKPPESGAQVQVVRRKERSTARRVGGPTDEPPSLRVLLGAVDPKEEHEGDDALSPALTAHRSRRDFRRSGGLTTNRAKAIPQGLGDLDALRLAILLERLDHSDLDLRTRWQLRVALRAIYLTGWSPAWLAALGTPDGPTVDLWQKTATIPGRLYAPEVLANRQQIQLTLGTELVRMLRSVIDADGRFKLELHAAGQQLSSSVVRMLLRYLYARDACPITLAMTRGAIWHVGRASGWTPERLVLATGSWDPAFARSFHYIEWPNHLDVAPLHEAMARRLKHGVERLQTIKSGGGFAVI